MCNPENSLKYTGASRKRVTHTAAEKLRGKDEKKERRNKKRKRNKRRKKKKKKMFSKMKRRVERSRDVRFCEEQN